MVLAHALHMRSQEMDVTYDPSAGHILPMIPLHRARYVMTRADFIRQLHNLAIFSIDSKSRVTASSVPMQRAMDEICSEPGFEKFLAATLERIEEIESQRRTKELTLKDLWNGGKYKLTTLNKQGKPEQTLLVEKVEETGKDDDEDEDG
jgi:hypothetical protein